MRLISFGIASPAAQRTRIENIMARRRGVPPSDPKVWFVSVASARDVFADQTSALHREIRMKYGVLMPEVAAASSTIAPDCGAMTPLAVPFKLVRMEREGTIVTDEALADRIIVAFD